MGFSIIGQEGQLFNILNERNSGDPMWIDDPMRPGHNVASTTFHIQNIASAFRDGFLSLGRHHDDVIHPTRLSRTLFFFFFFQTVQNLFPYISHI